MTIRARSLAFGLLTVAVVLIALHLGTQAVKAFTAHDQLFGMIDRFDVDEEASVPTWYAQTLWVIAAAIAWIIGRAERGVRAWWMGVAAVALLLSIDEGAAFHETGNLWSSRVFGTGIDLGIFELRDWALLGAIAVAVAALFIVCFVRRLPPRTGWLLASGCLLVVLGAVIWESFHWTGSGLDSTQYRWHLSTAGEEGLEMAGAIVIIYALADHAHRLALETKIRFAR